MIKKLFNPFFIAEKKLLLLGIVGLLIGSFLGNYFNARFDGLFDLHYVEKVTFFQSFSDILISIVITSGMLFAIGITINKKTRIIDLIITSLIAKMPFYILPIFNIGNKLYTVSNKLLELLNPKSEFKLQPNDILLLIVSSIVSLFVIVWSVVLLFNGFKTATNSKEVKHSILFIIGIIVSEIISKIIIWTIN